MGPQTRGKRLTIRTSEELSFRKMRPTAGSRAKEKKNKILKFQIIDSNLTIAIQL